MLGLKDRVLAIIAGGLALACALAAIYMWIGKNELERQIEKPGTGWRARLDACNADRATLKGNQGTLEASLARQTASLEAMRAAAATQAAQHAQARERAAAQVRTAQDRAAALGRRQPGTDICASADELILESLDG